MGTRAQTRAVPVIEPEHLETILVNGILIPEYYEPHFVVRLFERQATPSGPAAFVRMRVGISAEDFCMAIRVASAAAPRHLLRIAGMGR